MKSKNIYISDYEGINICSTPYDFRDKEKCVNNHIREMLNRTCTMFKYSGLPDTIPAKELEKQLQVHGAVIVTEVNGDLYSFYGGFGGQPNAYYLPTTVTVANPYLNFTKTVKIDEEGIVIRNDSTFTGLMPMFRKYSTLLTENELSIFINDVLKRTEVLFLGNNNKDKERATEFLTNLEHGKIGALTSNEFAESIRVQNINTGPSNIITQLLEVEQYIKASWFNELGLEMNHNMKRESINSAEASLNEDSLLPLIDDMLECRKTAIKKINEMFNTSINVELNSSWENRQVANEISLEKADLVNDNQLDNTEEVEQENDNK